MAVERKIHIVIWQGSSSHYRGSDQSPEVGYQIWFLLVEMCLRHGDLLRRGGEKCWSIYKWLVQPLVQSRRRLAEGLYLCGVVRGKRRQLGNESGGAGPRC